MTDGTRSPLPAGVLLDLSIAVCPLADDAVATTATEAVDRDHHARRRPELRELARRIDALPDAAREPVVRAMDEIQVRSKLWLIDELARRRHLAGAQVLVLGAWYGMLPLLVNLRLEQVPARMLCVDIDPGPCAVGRDLIGSLFPNVEYQCGDVMTYDYGPWGRDPTTVVVNTICEHLPDMGGWWRRLPPGQFVVLQSNNYFACPDHVNAVGSLAELKAQTPLSEVVFEGELPLPLFDRYMVMGQV